MFNKLIPTWQIAALFFAGGTAIGAYADHKIMQGRIDKMVIAHTEELRVREVKRGEDERAARETERGLALRAGKIEQEKTNEIAKIRDSYERTISGLQSRANRKPAGTGAAPAPGPACEGSTGAELSREDASFLVGEAARADEQRAALSACYQAYDAVAAPSGG